METAHKRNGNLPAERGRWSFGAKFQHVLVRAEDYRKALDPLGWYIENSDDRASPVAQKKPNGWGLYEMHGNDWEWCLDSVQPGTRQGSQPRVGLKDPLQQIGAFKIIKGGSFKAQFDQCRSAVRQGRPPSAKNSDAGFRVALGPVLSDPKPRTFVEPEASLLRKSKTFPGPNSRMHLCHGKSIAELLAN